MRTEVPREQDRISVPGSKNSNQCATQEFIWLPHGHIHFYYILNFTTQDKGPQRCPHLYAQNLWIHALTRQKGLCRRIKLRILKDRRLSRWTQVIIKVLIRVLQKGQSLEAKWGQKERERDVMMRETQRHRDWSEIPHCLAVKMEEGIKKCKGLSRSWERQKKKCLL